MCGIRSFLAMLGASAAFVVALPATASPISALTFTGETLNGAASTTTRGYSFDVTSAGLDAVSLGIWDADGDGLSEAHDVGLWNPAGTLIASVTIPSGTTALLADGFRYVDIAAVNLPIATGYTVGALFLIRSLDSQAVFLSGIATAPGIKYDTGEFINNDIATLTRPTSPFDGIPGGSLRVSSSTVPEPASLALLGLGLAGLGFSRRKKA